MSAWLNFGGRGILGGTLAARAFSAVTVCAALVASAVYVLGPPVEQHHKTLALFSRPGGGWWSMLCAVSTINAFASAGSWLLRAFVEAHFAGRKGVKGYG